MALEDADEIWLYIARQSDAERADAVIDTIDSKLDMLARHPNTGRNRDELRKGLRSFAVYRYLIFYLPLKDGIEVIRILHGARDFQRTEFDDN